MKRLGKIDICGIPFKVALGNAGERDALDKNYGYCDHQRHEIWIREGLSVEATEDTLLHEMHHALYENSGAAQFLKGAFPEGTDLAEIEETLIRIMIPHLRTALRQLKKLKA
jgi:hypothetical protein